MRVTSRVRVVLPRSSLLVDVSLLPIVRGRGAHARIQSFLVRGSSRRGMEVTLLLRMVRMLRRVGVGGGRVRRGEARRGDRGRGRGGEGSDSDAARGARVEEGARARARGCRRRHDALGGEPRELASDASFCPRVDHVDDAGVVEHREPRLRAVVVHDVEGVGLGRVVEDDDGVDVPSRAVLGHLADAKATTEPAMRTRRGRHERSGRGRSDPRGRARAARAPQGLIGNHRGTTPATATSAAATTPHRASLQCRARVDKPCEVETREEPRH